MRRWKSCSCTGIPQLYGYSPVVRVFPSCTGIPQLYGYSPVVRVFPSCTGIPQLYGYSPVVRVFPSCTGIPQLYGYSPVRPPTQQPSRNTLNCKLRSADCCCHLLIRTALKLAACLGANRVEKTNISYQKHKSLSLPSGRHLSYVQLTASLKLNLCTVLTTLKNNENC